MSTITASLNLHEAARKYAARGWPVLPLVGKVPVVGTSGYKGATTNLDLIDRLWAAHPTANVGIATGGPERVLVADVDGTEGEDALRELLGGEPPPTFTVRTGRTESGRHYYFKAPEGVLELGRAIGVRPKLDLLFGKGHVVAPPSIHSSGRRYEILHDAELAPAPAALIAAMREGAVRSPAAAEKPADTIREGGRNNYLTSLAGAIRRKGASGAAVLAALQAENDERCDPPLPEQEVEQIATSAIRFAADPMPLGPAVRSLAEILADPERKSAPGIVAARLAWQGRVSMLSAREKEGKSTLVTAAAAAVSSGRDFLGEPTRSGSVLWVAVEEHADDLATRFQRFRADPNRVFIVERLSSEFDDLDALSRELRPVLIVIDTLATFARRLVEDASASAQWIHVMTAFTSLARETDAATVLLHHARKDGGGYRDSTAIGGGVDAILEMTTKEGNPTARKVSGRARWETVNVEVNLDGDEYELVNGPLDLQTRVFRLIRRNPGLGLGKLRDLVGGRGENVDAAVSALLSAGRVKDVGTVNRHEYRAVKDAEDPDGHPHF